MRKRSSIEWYTDFKCCQRLFAVRRMMTMDRTSQWLGHGDNWQELKHPVKEAFKEEVTAAILQFLFKSYYVQQ